VASRISFARRSCAFWFFNQTISECSTLVTPAQPPASISARSTQHRKTSALMSNNSPTRRRLSTADSPV
jgi:hypothetical protein